MRSSPPGGISALPSIPWSRRGGCGDALVPTDEGPGRGAANAAECDSSCREKKFLRGGGEGRGGAGGEEVERGRAHARATVGCRRHVSSRATRATWPSLPALLSASRLFLNCIITIIVPNGNYNLRTNHVSQLQLGESNGPLFLLCASSCSSCFYLSRRVTGFFVTFVVWIRAVCNLLNRLCSPRCAKMQ